MIFFLLCIFFFPGDGWEGWEVGLQSLGMLSVGMLIPGGAFVAYRRWKKKDDNLVPSDHLQSNTNPVAEKSV